MTRVGDRHIRDDPEVVEDEGRHSEGGEMGSRREKGVRWQGEEMLQEMTGGNSGSVGFQEADAMRSQSRAELVEHGKTTKMERLWSRMRTGSTA